MDSRLNKDEIVFTKSFQWILKRSSFYNMLGIRGKYTMDLN